MSTSTLLPLKSLPNTRDLSSLNTKDGRKIKPKKLFRSGHLNGRDPKDITTLESLLDTVVDFRTHSEKEEKPDAIMKGVSYFHLPIFRDPQLGISHEKEIDISGMDIVIQDEEKALEHMKNLYRGIVIKDYPRHQYENFLRLFLEPHEKGILWHCTVGKDRAGLGTVLVEELLGVNQEDIYEDYLYTNECNKEELKILEEQFTNYFDEGHPVSKKALYYFLCADKELLDSFYEEIESEYGTIHNYFQKGLHLTDEDLDTIRNQFLE